MNDQDLDRLLRQWATADPTGAGDSAAVDRISKYGQRIATSHPPRSRWRRRWLGVAGGGAIAASLMVAMVGLTMRHQPLATSPVASEATDAGALSDAEQTDIAMFALLHVPTDDEEEMLI